MHDVQVDTGNGPGALSPDGGRQRPIAVICINVKVFELTILLSSAMNMVTQIIYFGRMEFGDWYYAVCLKKNS